MSSLISDILSEFWFYVIFGVFIYWLLDRSAERLVYLLLSIAVLPALNLATNRLYVREDEKFKYQPGRVHIRARRESGDDS